MKTALSIAGSDCSGGAGIQADLKTFSAHGVFGMTAVTSVVAENTFRVIEYQDVLEFHPECQLNSEPLRIDCVVIKKAKCSAWNRPMKRNFWKLSAN